jgi:hypothetical protein
MQVSSPQWHCIDSPGGAPAGVGDDARYGCVAVLEGNVTCNRDDRNVS